MKRESEVLMKYDVTKDGIVSNRETGRILKHQVSYKGYLRVAVFLEGKQHNVRIHRLVATKYVPNPFEYSQVNHKDSNKQTNHYSNLEWCTNKMNHDHAVDNGTIIHLGSHAPMAVLNEEEVLDIRIRLRNGESHSSLYNGFKDRISWWTFRDMLRGKAWKHVVLEDCKQ